VITIVLITGCSIEKETRKRTQNDYARVMSLVYAETPQIITQDALIADDIARVF
jgi:hypothetical protein